MAIRSSVVFLSGCNTGAGPSGSTSFDEGEDFATLVQAFLYAGAQNVIATLWPVEDASAARFAEAFYRALGGSSPSEALAVAQRFMLAQKGYRAPYYWAAYQLVGDNVHRAHKSLAQSVQHR